MFTFTIGGVVLEAETRRPLSGWYVKAYDKDLVFDDVLGSAVTAHDGTFTIYTEVSDFRELFERRPDVYFRVARRPGQEFVHDTESGVAFKVDELSHHEILVPVDAVSDPGAATVSVAGDDREPRQGFGAGENVSISATGLRPGTTYDARVEENGEELFTARLMTNGRGELPPTILWPQAFLDDPRREGALTIDEARERWRGADLGIVLGDGRKNSLEAGLGFIPEAAAPLAFIADAEGRPRNGLEPGTGPVFLTVTGLPYGGEGVVWLTHRRHDWQPGDAFEPSLLAGGEPAVFPVELPEPGATATLELVDSAALLPGPYDFIVRPIRYGWEEDERLRIGPRDVVSRLVTGLVVREDFWNAKPVLGGCVNKVPISGRLVSGSPYFRFSDTFAVGEDVWGAIDPGIVDPANVSKMCALYVVPSKNDVQWGADNSLAHLPALGGNPAVQRIKVESGCINCNQVRLWDNASQPGEYDVVADFGNNTPDAGTFVPDDAYDTPLDAIDGYFVAGFRVVPDPGTSGDFPHAGNFNYTETTNVPGFGLAGSVTVQDEDTSYHAPGAFTPVNTTVARRANVFFPASAAGVTDPAQIAAGGPYPVVVIVHGNGHQYTSYNALLTHLARNGFIAASIHLNGNMRALGRANVMFQHLPILQGVFGASMQNNIGLLGHSRGGEAILKAARLNSQDALGHGINALIPLAPTDQYGSERLELGWATPMFVLYGSRDGDIDGGIWTSGYTVPMTGFALYDRASGAQKSMAFVHRATHNGFVTSNYDAEAGDIPQLLTPADQQAVTMSYVNAFFRRYLKGETQWAGMFQGEWQPPSVPAHVELYIQYQDAAPTPVDSFQTGTGWQSSSGGATVSHSGLPADPNEGKMHDYPGDPGIDPRSPHDTRGLTLRWDTAGDVLDFTFPAAQDVSGFQAVSIRISQKEGSPNNPTNQLQNLRLALRDSGGNERAVRLGSFGEIPFPDQRADASLRKSAMTTIRVPLSAYRIVAAGAQQVDLTTVAALKLMFTETPTGEIDVDDVELTN
ncbi:MAG TPA: hypothetical protein VG318_04315 [Actinomycetota bacterium]|nr:hypothetical protein [Actinomycetota bacterium]